MKAATSPLYGYAITGYGQPSFTQAGWRPILECAPGDEQGS